LYNTLSEFLNAHIDQQCKTLKSSSGRNFLNAYLSSWKTYSTAARFIHQLFSYLNGHWIRQKRNDSRSKLAGHFIQGTSAEVYEIYVLMLITWKDRLFEQVKGTLTNGIIGLLTEERDNLQVQKEHKSLVTGLVQSYVQLGATNPNNRLEIYDQDFFTPFVADSRAYYSRESAAYIAQNGISAYMKRAEERIEEEEMRAKSYLDASSYDKHKTAIDEVLLESHKKRLQLECEPMLREERWDDLSRMFRLLGRITNGLDPMLQELEKYVTNVGFSKVKALNIDAALKPGRRPVRGQPNPGKIYIEALLAVHGQFSSVVKKAFNNDALFVAALDRACRKIVNENHINKKSKGKSPELLAKYCDILLKKSNKHMDETELDAKLAQTIMVFKYVDDKDVFQKFYARMLAKRLIHGTSASDDAEKVMIAGLKETSGFEYTSKLQRMFNDIQLSTEINTKFSEEDKKLPVDFSILVLTAGSWPLQTQSSNFNVPEEMEMCISSFTQFYNSMHHGRKLNWIHHLSKGDVKTLYLKRRYEFQATNYQISMLAMFNNADSITTEEFKNTTGLAATEFERTLRSLVDCKLLSHGAKGPLPREIPSTKTFELNKRFASKRVRFKITAPMQTETKGENNHTRKLVEDDRRVYLQAAIVRIMKMRKVLTHNNLIKEVIQQAQKRFQPNIQLIKRCIEGLIEKEYLCREDGTDKYKYLA